MSLEERAGARENIEDFLLAGVHAATLGKALQKTKSILLVVAGLLYAAAL